MDLSTWTKRIVNVTKLFDALREVLVLPNKFGLFRIENDFAGQDTPDSLLCIYYPQILCGGATKHSLGEFCKSKKMQSVILFTPLKLSGGTNSGL
jgi:hypothetical protein